MTTDLKIQAGGLLIENGDLQLHTDNTQSIQQRLDIVLNMYRGEWWLNRLAGIPYLQEILSVKASVGVAESILKNAILNTTGVNKILSFNTVHNPSSGLLTVSFEVQTDLGEIFSVQNRELT